MLYFTLQCARGPPCPPHLHVDVNAVNKVGHVCTAGLASSAWTTFVRSLQAAHIGAVSSSRTCVWGVWVGGDH